MWDRLHIKKLIIIFFTYAIGLGLFLIEYSKVYLKNTTQETHSIVIENLNKSLTDILNHLIELNDSENFTQKLLVFKKAFSLSSNFNVFDEIVFIKNEKAYTADTISDIKPYKNLILFNNGLYPYDNNNYFLISHADLNKKISIIGFISKKNYALAIHYLGNHDLIFSYKKFLVKQIILILTVTLLFYLIVQYLVLKKTNLNTSKLDSIHNKYKSEQTELVSTIVNQKLDINNLKNNNKYLLSAIKKHKMFLDGLYKRLHILNGCIDVNNELIKISQKNLS